MTTPENLKRRQQRELRGLIVVGLAVLVVGIAQLGTYIHFQRANHSQRTCIATNVGGLVTSLVARGAIAARESKATRLESKATRLESKALNIDFLPKAFAATSQAELFKAYARYRIELVQVNKMRTAVDNRRAQIAKDRDLHPIPAFPEGRCE